MRWFRDHCLRTENENKEFQVSEPIPSGWRKERATPARRKFHGKVSVEKVVVLMRRFANHHDMVCKYIILCKDRVTGERPSSVLSLHPLPCVLSCAVQTVVEKLKKEEEEKKNSRNKADRDKDIQDIADRLKVLPLTEKNLKMFNNANKNWIPSCDQQFSCKQCDSMWWRRVPERKQVSRCFRCKQKYDPVPPEKRWGQAEFHCPSCNRMFRGFTQMGMPCPCYICGIPVQPDCIIPPRRGPGPRSRNPHSCYAEDCYNRREPHIPGTHCVHPRSRTRNNLPKVLHPSGTHVSTGSTVATCLSQGSLLIGDIDDIILDDLRESDEEDKSSESDNSDN
ncbi:LOW QUALITY PROTEIN: repressor of yield of DENV protein [Rhinatrema bivittatum]|uniref:LOW QUALITY PROTEIN: repressor of yield of DENV protein n=1 Tax=Rhinatrema bivittatum TaxID=194408 RepID=UPI00112CA600|nr:LOW QUALITY PROTEIN: repressor of yield of DENV protein [Rhinatrema bivittatum]